VVAEAADAVVEVDGARVGLAPVAVDLPIGQHVVVARAPGWVARGEGFAAAAGGGERVIHLDRDDGAAAVLAGERALAIGTDEAAARAAVQGLVVYGDLDGVLLVAAAWRRGAPALLGQWCAGAPVRCGRVAEIGFAAAERLPLAARLLWQRVERDGDFPPTLLVDARLVSAEPAPIDPERRRPGPRGRRWWRWAIAGAGVAAATAGAILLAARDSEIRPVVVVAPCDFGGCR
jgi:hypothetical protein